MGLWVSSCPVFTPAAMHFTASRFSMINEVMLPLGCMKICLIKQQNVPTRIAASIVKDRLLVWRSRGRNAHMRLEGLPEGHVMVAKRSKRLPQLNNKQGAKIEISCHCSSLSCGMPAPSPQPES